MLQHCVWLEQIFPALQGLAIAVENYLTSPDAYHKHSWSSLMLSYLIVGLDEKNLRIMSLRRIGYDNHLSNMDTAFPLETTYLFEKMTSSGFWL